MKVNNINIMDYYLKTYNSTEDFIYNNEKEVNCSLSKNITAIDINCSFLNSISYKLCAYAHPSF